MKDIELAAVAKIRFMLPARRSIIAGPPPLYGTWVIFVPACRLNSSRARCPVPPTPDEPPFSGLVLARFTRSVTDLTGRDGWTIRMLVESTACVTGMRSLNVSNGIFARWGIGRAHV